MPIYDFRVVRLCLVPAAFCAAALGLFGYSIAIKGGVEGVAHNTAGAIAPGGFRTRQRVGSLSLSDDLTAKLRRARQYAEGDGVQRNDAEAFRTYREIANRYTDADPRDKGVQQISEAFRRLASYYRVGVPEASVPADASYAFSLLHYAASYFGDPASQFELARTILNGEGVEKNNRIAAQWLLNASRKGYAPAQALLGHLLWKGEGVERVAGDGLGLLAVARANAASEDKLWIGKLFGEARRTASADDILSANAFIMQESPAFRSRLGTQSLINSDDASDAGWTAFQPVAATGTPSESQAVKRENVRVGAAEQLQMPSAR